MENRVFRRLHTPITVKYLIPEGAHGEARVNDISLGGVCLPLAQKANLCPGTSLMLKIKMPHLERETVIFGEVIWLKKPEALMDVEYIAGIRFIKADILDIENIISSLRTGMYFTSDR